MDSKPRADKTIKITGPTDARLIAYCKKNGLTKYKFVERAVNAAMDDPEILEKRNQPN